MDRLFEFAGNHWELVSVFVGLLFALWWTEKAKGGQALSPLAVTQLLNQGNALVIDIRDKKEFTEGRITGSIHMPFTTFKDRIAELEEHKSKHLIVADKMGQHSSSIGKMLKAEGFENVSRLSGGITEWKNSNIPLVKK